MNKAGTAKLDIVIVGAGGFGREVYGWAKDVFSKDRYTFKGFLDKDPDSFKGHHLTLPVLGDEGTYAIQENDRFVLAIGEGNVKKSIVLELKQKGAQFLTLVHPTAIVAGTAKLGEGVVICPFAVVCDGVVLDDFVMMNLYASCGHDARVGKYSILCPYTAVNGDVVIGEQVYLGSHSTVARYKKVGQKAKVSANSTVMQDVPEHGFVYVVPGITKVIF